MAERRRELRKESVRRESRGGLPAAVFVTLIAALAAGAAGHFLTGVAGWAAMGAVALVGATLAAVAGSRSGGSGDLKSRVLLSVLDRGGSAETKVPQGFAGEWAALYERVNRMSLESHTNSSALAELERFRRQVELAEAALRSGKDPLTEIAELRVGPLRDLLEAAKNGATVGPVVSRLALGEEELIGADGDALPEGWPKASALSAPPPIAHEELSRGLDELLRGIADLSASLGGAQDSRSARLVGETIGRSPAQLVDAVVHTAADGIEDLAAGLMRANELASVAERVTNRATLLALNAALEATRSGSEAFAAIAEETRRLAEFAREATDTISRLASEIEYKVGETITAIHATSEDAKASFADLPGGASPAPAVRHEVGARVEKLLEGARELKRLLHAPAAAASAPPSSGFESHAPASPASPDFDRDRELPSDDSAADSTFDVLAEPGSPEVVADSPSASDPMQSLLENDRFRADKSSAEGILLIEGLQPGARLDR
ncbi:MAG: hypothetical protein HY568_02600 [Candidatus Latescibacteria bacterium]|nr:hypothetical protein [Candidatus Latescibacterota bacterium]